MPSSTDTHIPLRGSAHMLVHPGSPGAVGGVLVGAYVALEEPAGVGAVRQLDQLLPRPPRPGAAPRPARAATGLATSLAPACRTSSRPT